MTLLRTGGTGEFRESPNLVFYIYLPINLESLEIILLYGNNYENTFFFPFNAFASIIYYVLRAQVYTKSDQKRGIICTMYIIHRSNHSRGCYNINTSCRATILRIYIYIYCTHTIILLSCKKTHEYTHNYYESDV